MRRMQATALLLLALLPAACMARSAMRPAASDGVAAVPSCAQCQVGLGALLSVAPDADAVVRAMQQEVCASAAEPQKCRRQAAAILPVLVSRAQRSITPSQLCVASGSCSVQQGALHALHEERQRKALGDGPTCAMCAFLVNRVKLYLNDTSVQQTIIDAADKACSTLPAEFAKTCTDFVDTYEPILIQWLEGTDTATMCMLMGACILLDAPHSGPHSAPHSIPHIAPRFAPHAAAPQQSHQSAAALPLGVVGPLTSLGIALESYDGASNSACDVCKVVCGVQAGAGNSNAGLGRKACWSAWMAVIQAHSIASNPDVQANLVNYTKSLCVFAGGPFTQECDDFVDTYAPATFDFIEKLLTPDQLCAQLGVCKVSLLQSWRAQAQAVVSKLRLGGALLAGQQGEDA